MLPRPLSSTRTDTLFPHTTLCRSLYFINDEPFAVILADDLVLAGTPCIKQLVDAHAATGGNIDAVMDVPKDQTDRYGILDFESEDGRLAAVGRKSVGTGKRVSARVDHGGCGLIKKQKILS